MMAGIKPTVDESVLLPLMEKKVLTMLLKILPLKSSYSPPEHHKKNVYSCEVYPEKMCYLLKQSINDKKRLMHTIFQEL